MNKKYTKSDLENLPRSWWLRSVYSGSSYYISDVYNRGYVDYSYIYYDYDVLFASFEI